MGGHGGLFAHKRQSATDDSADHVAIIDTTTDQVVAFVPTPAGTHGVNWGAKRGGGYYAYVTNQHANVLTIIDPDPNGDSNGADAAAVGNNTVSRTAAKAQARLMAPAGKE